MSSAVTGDRKLPQEQAVLANINKKHDRVDKSLFWLKENMHPYFLPQWKTKRMH